MMFSAQSNKKIYSRNIIYEYDTSKHFVCLIIKKNKILSVVLVLHEVLGR